jgi:glycerophosphoryl diester phosphodiesterase
MDLLYSANGKVLNIAHRGTRRGGIPNTLESIRQSLSSDINGVEIDVQATKDGKLVVFHDEEIAIQGKKRQIRSLKFNEVRSVDLGGAQVPLLEEVFCEVQKTSCPLIIDVKSRGIVSEILDQAKRYNLHDNLIISSFDYLALKQVCRLAPHVSRGVTVGFSRISRRASGLAWTIFTYLFPVQAAQWVKARVILCSSKRLTNGVIRGAHKHRIAVFVWVKSSSYGAPHLGDIQIDGVLMG